MSISVEGQNCPVCHGHLFDDDELVFCPVCGAPHHKDCYAKLQHCAMDQFHGTDMEYKRPDVHLHEDDANSSHKQEHSSKEDALKSCQNCGFSLPDDARFCPNCKHPVDQKLTGGMSFITMMPSDYDPYGGIKKDQQIDDVTAEELRNYVVINTSRYIPKFFKMNKSNKISWNWAAFLFPQGWFFYRKINSIGIIALVLFVCSSLLSSSFGILLQQVMDSAPVDYFKSYPQIVTYLLDNSNKFDLFPMYTAFAGLILNFITRLVSGVFGDWFYRTSALERIEKVKDDKEVDDLPLGLRTMGGINPLVAFLAIFGQSIIANILFQLI